jgi:predicted ester cyclase
MAPVLVVLKLVSRTPTMALVTLLSRHAAKLWPIHPRLPWQVTKEAALNSDNKEIVRRIEEAWDRGDLSALEECFAPDFVAHSAAPGLPPGLEGAKMAHQGALQAFPDRRVTIEEIVCEGDLVAVRCRMRGTNQGGLPWLGIPANGRSVDVEWVSIYRLTGGRVVEHRGVMDLFSLVQQLGAAPLPA